MSSLRCLASVQPLLVADDECVGVGLGEVFVLRILHVLVNVGKNGVTQQIGASNSSISAGLSEIYPLAGPTKSLRPLRDS
jgi:hypothetical protein